MSQLFTPIHTAELKWRGDLPFSAVFDDIYFSAEGGPKQTIHVFINGNNLIPRWQALPNKGSWFTIGETGFGTGLNFLMTWHLWEQYAPAASRLHFISCEKHPLTLHDLKKSLGYWPELSRQATELIQHYPVLTPGYHQVSFAKGRVRLTLMLGDALDSFEQLLHCGDPILEPELKTASIDAWYLDGFTPKKNESMWSESLFKVVALLSTTGTTVASYTAAAVVKSRLKDVGFIVEKRKGFGAKRHMISATLEKNTSCQIKSRHTPWHLSTPKVNHNQSALIIGAGLAGSFTAHALASRGWQVTIIDELDEAGAGGSANSQAVVFPKLSAYQSPLTHFMLMAFIHAYTTYERLVQHELLGELKGIVLLAYNEKERILQQGLAQWLVNYPELGSLITTEQVSQLTGLALQHTGLWIPRSGWINSPRLCNHLIQHPNIALVTGVSVDSLLYDQHQWIIQDKAAPVLILANGPKVRQFKETQHLPVTVIRGQMTTMASTPMSRSLLVPICAEGHILPEWNQWHHIGASYDLNVTDSECKPQDDEANILKLDHISTDTIWSKQVTGHWAGVRASTPDYLPLVGPAPKAEAFNTLYAGLDTNSKRWIAKAGPYYPGLYICAAFGSRGLTTIPLCAEWLAASINNEISCLPRYLIQALSPARFLRRSIVRKS